MLASPPQTPGTIILLLCEHLSASPRPPHNPQGFLTHLHAIDQKEEEVVKRVSLGYKMRPVERKKGEGWGEGKKRGRGEERKEDETRRRVGGR